MEIDQFATRKLSPAESRKLAQQALADEDLFDALVAQGAVEASLQIPAIARPVRRMPWVIGVLAAAAAVILAVFLLRNKVVEPSPAVVAIAKPVVVPSFDATSGRPVLLASELSPARSSDKAEFRGDAAPNREPETSGVVTAIEGDEATVSLGSLDGLEKGTEIGGIVITTVFRDHARGKAAPGASVHVKDRIPVPAAMHIAAVSREVDALTAAGNIMEARVLARGALAAGSSGETRQILEKIAALDYQAGAIDAAREHYESAANNFFDAPAASPTQQAQTLNSLGALYLLRGDSASATKPLNQAAAITAINPDLRAEILNNLGVLDEMRGDLTSARDHYQQASAHQNKIAQDNLNRVAIKRP